MFIANAEEEPIGLINGKGGASRPEWRVAKALWRYGWEFSYQTSLFMGRRAIGGTVVDFIVFTVPMATPIYVDGEYWHGSASKREKDKILRDRIRTHFRGQLKDYIALKGADLQTQEMANQAILKAIGRNN